MKILKLGGSVITDKSGYRKAKPESIEKLARCVAGIWKRGARDLILVHGAGSFGHAVVIKHGLENGVKNTAQKLGYADTHAACCELSSMLVGALIANGAPAVSIPPAMVLSLKDKRIARFDTKIVNDYLQSGYLPVLFGDMAPDSALGGYPCSGDQIVAYLGKGADMIVLATDVDGVIGDNGAVIPLITRQNLQEISKHLKLTENDVTGGMKGKLEELLGLDTVSYIVNGNCPERLESLFLGKPAPCTQINELKK
ncbi:isopentenyl phosphate kinase family protein [Candidatus Micrarchaeota archaeon]|nr:isopentenyl phosphate kinase family protein [Candidatus Micrarchaeota archaeon]